MKTEERRPEDEGTKHFANFVAEVCDGDLNAEVSAELQSLLLQLRDAQHRDGGKAKGKLTLTLALNYDGKALGVSYDVSSKRPPKARASGHCWITRGGNFSMKNPRQMELPIRDVSARPAVIEDGASAPRMAEGV